MKLGEVFDPRNNALNAWRLALAAEVILWHSFPLTGRSVSSGPVRQLLFSLGVDGFLRSPDSSSPRAGFAIHAPGSIELVPGGEARTVVEDSSATKAVGAGTAGGVVRSEDHHHDAGIG